MRRSASLTLSGDEAQRIEREPRSGRLVLLYAAPRAC